MSLSAAEGTGVFLAVTVALDVVASRFPAWWLLVSVLGAILFSSSVTMLLLGGALGLAAGMLADVPGGDLRALLVFGMLAAPEGGVSLAAGSIALTFLLTLAAWRWGLIGVPWTVYLAGAWGVIVVGINVHTMG